MELIQQIRVQSANVVLINEVHALDLAATSSVVSEHVDALQRVPDFHGYLLAGSWCCLN